MPTPSPSSTVTRRPTGLDLDLIRKYSIPGPRYTSYPPATIFTADLAALRLDEAIADDNRAGAGPLSLYFHLPFCETRCWFLRAATPSSPAATMRPVNTWPTLSAK